jgi:hypothetical protein
MEETTMSTPGDGVENTGDNLRRAAEETGQADETSPGLNPEDPGIATPPLDSGRASEPPQSDK